VYSLSLSGDGGSFLFSDFLLFSGLFLSHTS
jgi:hypothetical protein